MLLHAGGELAHADLVGDLDLELLLARDLELEAVHLVPLLLTALGRGALLTITTKKGKVIEFTKKLEIYNPTAEELQEWDKTHEHKFISRMRDPPADQVGGNTGIIGDLW